MITLARKLRVVDYFTLGWGTMVGVGWLVVMDDWLLRGGVLGAVLGFAIGGTLLLPVGYVYARLVKAMPDASGEVAYTAKVFPQSSQLRHRLDDGALLLHRLSLGSGRRRQDCSLHFSGARLRGGVSHRRTAGVFAAPAHRAGTYRTDHAAELPRRPPQCHLPELDNLRNARALCGVRQRGCQQGLATQLPALVHAWRVCLGAAGAADRALFHDRIRVGRQGGGGSQSGASRPGFSHGNLVGDRGGRSLLYRDHRRGSLCGALERLGGREIHDCSRF